MHTYSSVAKSDKNSLYAIVTHVTRENRKGLFRFIVSRDIIAEKPTVKVTSHTMKDGPL